MGLYLWHIFVYAAGLVFLLTVIYRITAINRLPVHLRWELAPVPHEKGKNHYGGSYLEDFEWWKKKRNISYFVPIMYLGKEIFLLKGVWQNNKKLWPFSFALHAGLYILVLLIFLYILISLLMLTATSSELCRILIVITSIFSIIAYVLGTSGCLGLLLERALDSNLREFSTLAAYFNLILLIFVFGSGLFAWSTTSGFSMMQVDFVFKIVTFQGGIFLPVQMAVHIILTLLFIVYFPFTHMLHFVAKYFMYHRVRWDDVPLNKNMQQKLHNLAMQQMSWSSDHVSTRNSKSWAYIATEERDFEEKA